MKPSPSKSMKTVGGKKRSTPRPNPKKEWKKSKAKTEDPSALLKSGFLWEKEVDMWRAAA
jgi:hypothetical protein